MRTPVNTGSGTAPDGAPSWVTGAIASLDLQAVRAEQIFNDDPFSPTPRTFLILTSDGQRLKARRTLNARHAERAARLASRLADHRVPELVGRWGRVTIERWVEGCSLSSLRPRPGQIDAAADLLAFIHGHPGTPGLRLPQMRSAVRVLTGLDALLIRLHGGALIDARRVRVLKEILRERLPSRALWGVTHNDLTSSNLVIDAHGRLISIDNEHLGWGFLDGDLARTWARWPMSSEASDRFEERYLAQSGRRADPGGRQGWRIAAALSGVGIRLTHGGSLEVPMIRLRAALADVGITLAFPTLEHSRFG